LDTLKRLATATKAEGWWSYSYPPRVGVRAEVSYAHAMTLSIEWG